MPKIYGNAESVEAIARTLIPNYHPELADARINYIFVDKASMDGDRPVLGKARKMSGALEFLVEADFVIEVALDQWNEMAEDQRTALVDHLLEWCTGEEEEESGEMKWGLRKPDVHEFSSILRRHGAWHDSLSAFVSIARNIPIDQMVQEAEGDQQQQSVETE